MRRVAFADDSDAINGVVVRGEVFFDESGDKFFKNDIPVQFNDECTVRRTSGSSAWTAARPSGLFRTPATSGSGIPAKVFRSPRPEVISPLAAERSATTENRRRPSSSNRPKAATRCPGGIDPVRFVIPAVGEWPPVRRIECRPC